MNKTKKLILISFFSAFASLIGLFENAIPIPFIAPGLKLGLSNVFVLVGLVIFGLKEGIAISLLKSILLMLLSGNVSSFLYSFLGALLSSIFMSIFLNFDTKFFSLIGVSIVGSSFHNIGQILMAFLVLKSKAIFSYLPIILSIGIITGFFVGLTSNYVLKKLDKNKIYINRKEWINY